MDITGSTRIIYIIGDPIAQVKSPQGMTAFFHDEYGQDICVVPAHVTADDLGVFIKGAQTLHNCLGVIATMPHKREMAALCDDLSTAAHIVGAVNVARFQDDKIYGDHVDGQGMLNAAAKHNITVTGKTALLAGAGGAGAAIAYSVLEGGVSKLLIYDCDRAKSDALSSRLSPSYGARISVLTDMQPADILINATPVGMGMDDPSIFHHDLIEHAKSVCDVVGTEGRDTPLIKYAKYIGKPTVSGSDLFLGLRHPMAAFFCQRGS